MSSNFAPSIQQLDQNIVQNTFENTNTKHPPFMNQNQNQVCYNNPYQISKNNEGINLLKVKPAPIQQVQTSYRQNSQILVQHNIERKFTYGENELKPQQQFQLNQSMTLSQSINVNVRVNFIRTDLGQTHPPQNVSINKTIYEAAKQFGIDLQNFHTVAIAQRTITDFNQTLQQIYKDSPKPPLIVIRYFKRSDGGEL